MPLSCDVVVFQTIHITEAVQRRREHCHLSAAPSESGGSHSHTLTQTSCVKFDSTDVVGVMYRYTVHVFTKLYSVRIRCGISPMLRQTHSNIVYRLVHLI